MAIITVTVLISLLIRECLFFIVNALYDKGAKGRKKRLFKFKYQHASGISAPTEIFVPNYNYPHGYRVIVSDGKWQKDTGNQTLTYWHTTAQNLHEVKILPES